MIDSHCHLDFKDFAHDRSEVLTRARQEGVTGFVCIGAGGDLGPAQACVSLAEENADIVATVGIHPHDADVLDEELWSALRALGERPRVVGIGESGLDYHYDRAPRVRQQEVFERFAQLASELGRTLVCHVREAHTDAVDVLRRCQAPRTVIHSFTGDVADARRYLDLGCYLSFSGILTFKNAEALREAAAFAPEHRLLIETDAPYLAPVPLRGRRNEPAFLAHTLRTLAAVRGVAPEAMATATATNSVAAFQLPPSWAKVQDVPET